MLWDQIEVLDTFFPSGGVVTTAAVLVFADWLDDHGEPAAAEFLRLDAGLALADDPDSADVQRWLAVWPNEEYTDILVPRDLVAFRVTGHCLYCGNRESNECNYGGRSNYSEGYARAWNPYLNLVYHRYRHRCRNCGREEAFEATETYEGWDRSNGGAPGCPGCLPLRRD